MHRLEGLLIALDHPDAMIELIRNSRNRDTARTGLMVRFELTQIQAEAILELRLEQLTALDAEALRREHAGLMERIRELRELLGDEDKVLGLIEEELQEIAERYGDEHRTKISPAEDDLDIEDLIADQQMVISITNSSYIKSLPLATYRQQRRGGVGIIGMEMKEDDYIEHLFVCSTHDYLLFFTNRGKVYRSKVYDLPEAGRTSKGRYLGNVLPLRDGERVQSVLATRDFSETEFLMFATRAREGLAPAASGHPLGRRGVVLSTTEAHGRQRRHQRQQRAAAHGVRRPGHHRPRGPRGGPQASWHVHRLDRCARPAPPGLRDRRQLGRRGAGRPQRRRRGHDPPGQLRHRRRRRPRHPRRDHGEGAEAGRRGRADGPARRRQVRRRRRLQGLRRPARRRPLRRQRALGAAGRRDPARGPRPPPELRARHPAGRAHKDEAASRPARRSPSCRTPRSSSRSSSTSRRSSSACARRPS